MYQRDKSSDSKVKFTQAGNHCKRVLQAAKLAYANNQRVYYFPENLAFRTLNFSAYEKGKLFAGNFFRNSHLDDSGISLPVFNSRTNLKLYNISVTHKIVKKVIMNLELSTASGHDCVRVMVLKKSELELAYILA